MIKEIKANAVYSTKDVADFLRVTPKTVERLCREGKLKAVKLRKYKILGQSIIDFFYSNMIKKVDKLQKEVEESIEIENEKNRK